jgi:hypothetical protein
MHSLQYDFVNHGYVWGVCVDFDVNIRAQIHASVESCERACARVCLWYYYVVACARVYAYISRRLRLYAR